MSIEFVLIVGVVAAIVMGSFSRFRLSFLGLFSVATLLYMEASNAFLSAQSVTYYNQGQQLHTIRTVTAGAIMTAVVNGLLIIALGMDDTVAYEAKPKEAEAAENKA